MTRIAIYDTTLRDGSQGEGVNFSLQDKLQITQRLDNSFGKAPPNPNARDPSVAFTKFRAKLRLLSRNLPCGCRDDFP